ncbi:hypothetical protein N9D38_02105 [Rubripirellula sp.]|nr:hypothetical protein [Rubripirellula sp.]
MSELPNRLLPATWDVPKTFRDRLGKAVGRQRMMFSDGHLLLVLHAPPERDQEERIGRFFWRKPDGTWSSNNLGSGLGSLLKHLEEYDRYLDRLEEQEQQASRARDFFEINDHLAPLLRASSNLHAVLHDARKHCPDIRELIDARDRAYGIERAAELLAVGCKNGLDYQMARQAEEQSEAGHRMAVASHRLNRIVAFFLPLATLSGLFGVNLRSGLEDVPAPYAFLGVTMIALLIGGFFSLMLRGNEAPKSKQ